MYLFVAAYLRVINFIKMQSLSDSLKPYKEEVGSLAGIVTIAQFFSGAVICYEIHKKKSTKGNSSIPFVGGLVLYVFYNYSFYIPTFFNI